MTEKLNLIYEFCDNQISEFRSLRKYRTVTYNVGYVEAMKEVKKLIESLSE